MIILLVLLPALVSGARESVDWTKCAAQISCFCGDASDPPILERHLGDGQGCEKVGIQSQFFTENSGLFQAQLTIDPNDPVLSGNANPRLTILYGSAKLFGCEYSRTKSEVTLFGDEEQIFANRIKLFEENFKERSYLDKGIVVCAVTVGRITKFIQKLISPLGEQKVAIMWSAGDSETNSKLFKDKEPREFLFNSKYKTRCNPAFKDLLSSQDYYVKPIRNKDRFNLNCDNYGASYTMRYEKAGDVKEMKELNCIEKAPHVYSYSIDTGEKDAATNENILIDVPDPESYSIFCTSTFNELCENPNTCTKAEDPNCPDYEAGSKGKAANLTCPDNKWKIKDEYYVLKAQPACERNKILDTNGASFVAVLPSNQRVLITKDARCFTDWDCKKKSNLNIPSGSVIIENGIMKCNDTEAKMIVYHHETNTTMTGAQSYKCDPAEGVFFNEANVTETVPANSRVSCRVNKTISATTAEPSITKGQVIGIIVGVAFLLILLVIGLATCGFCCYRHRNDVSIKNLKDMNRSALAEKCIKDFHHIVKATPSNAYLIVVGFTLVDKMLEMEVDDPKAWEEAGKFLTRAHGSIMRRDFQVWHLLSRYCHLQAIKIIDKYGWRTDAPITKANPKGIIRCVAVQLLAFCLNDQANYTAEECIEFGYGKLGFRGSSQYPHAGVMWSVVPHTRRGAYVRSAKHPHILINGFDKALFCDITRKIACKKIPIAIPDADVIPEFGTVEEQAAYALGGQPRHTYLVKETKNILFGTPEMPAICAPIAYLKGMCESRGRDPAQILLESCKIFSSEKEEFLAKMNLLAPEPVWHNVWRNAFQLLAVYGRDLDIQRIHSSFMPKDKSTDFFEIQREQANFEKAIDSALEDIRKWLAEHTDRDEFKKKPTMVVNPKVKLRDRRYAAGQAGGCSTSDKSSGAGKPPAAAAAAAAGTPVAAGTAPAPLAAGSPGAAATTAAAAAAAPAAGPPIAAPAAPAAAAVSTAPLAPTPTA